VLEKEYLIIDLNQRLVIPGFVDSHMHLDKALINETVINKSGTLTEAIQIMQSYKKEMTKEEVKERAEKVIQLSLENGTRFIRTHIDVDNDIKLSSIDALLELKEKYKNSLEIQIVAFPQEGINENPENLLFMDNALKRGADLVGGIPAIEKDPIKHIKDLTALALKYDVDIDMHIDETDDPNSLTILDLAETTIANKYEGRVTACHLCSLAAQKVGKLEKIANRIVKAKINVISLPSTNLYLQGRGSETNAPRGVTPVRYLHSRNIPVMIGSDNIQDPFNPFGNGNMLEEALIAAHACHMGGEKELATLFDMTTVIPGENLKFDYAIKIGEKAKFIVLDSYTKASAIVKQVSIYGDFLNENFTIRNK
jgi:cytosine deaminase